ncbi:hypothetical protein B0H67DRAFT_650066 [Lasiosphaeris hirsuta]|uniref:Uncharacterized protein n=1 Tax=Lasiosphaeris hirsuta TaxID=260670 RepID=A0AA39ZS95_9PEZI|nr:hypothetical protein B0H67DRAFT_650066 [Lasiosphaeris hirsuta]
MALKMNPVAILLSATAAAGVRIALEHIQGRIKKARRIKNENLVREEVPYIHSKLQRARMDNLLDADDFSYWGERLWQAERDFDLPRLRAINLYLDALFHRAKVVKKDIEKERKNSVRFED